MGNGILLKKPLIRHFYLEPFFWLLTVFISTAFLFRSILGHKFYLSCGFLAAVLFLLCRSSFYTGFNASIFCSISEFKALVLAFIVFNLSTKSFVSQFEIFPSALKYLLWDLIFFVSSTFSNQRLLGHQY